MAINFSNILKKVQVAVAVGKVIFTEGKTAKVLDQAEKGTEIAQAIKDLVKPPKNTQPVN